MTVTEWAVVGIEVETTAVIVVPVYSASVDCVVDELYDNSVVLNSVMVEPEVDVGEVFVTYGEELKGCEFG